MSPVLNWIDQNGEARQTVCVLAKLFYFPWSGSYVILGAEQSN